MSLNPDFRPSRARLQTPPGPLGVLCEPALSVPALRRSVDEWSRSIASVRADGVPLTEHRRDLRAVLGDPAPRIVTGHQVEFFHAGVLAKVIAADALAKRISARPLFIAVDSDTPKTMRLASVQEQRSGVRRVEVLIPGLDSARAVESQPRLSRAAWMDFFARVAEFTPHYESSALREFVSGWMNTDADDLDFTGAMGRGHEAVQAALGMDVPHVRLSRLCETEAYRAFLRQIVADAERFAAVYNAAQRHYRDRYRVRSSQRPVPPLVLDDEWVELPFWHLSEEGRRGRLFRRRTEKRLGIAGEQPGTIDLAAGISEETMFAAGSDGAWARRIRPRALTLTMFLRMFVADVFIHGIGGAKYDEMTDEIIVEFFGVPPPPMICVSATLHLYSPGGAAARGDRREAARAARDVRYNPQRYLADVPAEWIARRTELIRKGEELRRDDRLNRAARREVHRALRALNQELLMKQPWRVAELTGALEQVLAYDQEDRLRAAREVFCGLHPLARLQELVRAVHQQVL